MPLIPRLHSLLFCMLFACALILSSCADNQEVSNEGAQDSELRLQAVPDALVSVSLPGLQGSLQRLGAGIYGQIWQLSFMEEARQGWDEMLAEFEAETGVSGAQAWSDLKGLEWRLLDWNSDMQGLIDLGASSVGIWAFLSQEMEETPAPSGIEAALLIPDSEDAVLGLAGSQIRLRSGENTSFLDALQEIGEDDLRLTWSGERLQALLQRMSSLLPDAEQEMSSYERIDDGELRIRILPDGIRESLLIRGRELDTGAGNIDHAVVDRVPEDALLLLAAAMDGPASAAYFYLREMLEMLAEGGGSLDNDFFPLSEMADWMELIEGTMVLAILPPPMGAPFPGVSLQLPLQDGLIALAQDWIDMFGASIPAVGSQQRLDLPIPMPVILARNDSHLLVTSVPAHATAWLAGEGGGFTAHPAYQQARQRHSHGSLSLIGASDTPRILALLSNLYDSYGGLIPLPDESLIPDLLQVLSSHRSYGYLLGSVSPDLLRWESKGLLGSAVMLPMLMPSVSHARGRAQRLESMNNARQIAMSLFMYQDDYNRYPSPPEGVAWPEDPQLATAAIFEHLALKMELPHPLFIAAQTGSPLATAARSDVSEIWQNPNPDWAHSFALDWSAPMTSPATRVLIASRYPVNREGQVVVVYADYSFALLTAEELAADRRVLRLANPRIIEDRNIFAADDEQDWQTVGRGPRNRSWVR